MEKLNRKKLHSNIIYTFILGVLWGLLEIIANEFLIPNNIYIKGLIFSSIAVLILIFSKKIINYEFSLLFVSIIALLIIFASRGFSFNVMIAILFEALIAEVIFLSLKQNHITTMAVGASIFLYSFIHGLIFHGSLPGNYITYLYKQMFTDLFGIDISAEYYLVILFWGLISCLLGITIGWFSWRLCLRLNQKSIEEIINC
jgi:hypothetical protein